VFKSDESLGVLLWSLYHAAVKVLGLLPLFVISAGVQRFLVQVNRGQL